MGAIVDFTKITKSWFVVAKCVAGKDLWFDSGMLGYQHILKVLTDFTPTLKWDFINQHLLSRGMVAEIEEAISSIARNISDYMTKYIRSWGAWGYRKGVALLC